MAASFSKERSISADISLCSTWMQVDSDDDDYIPYGGIYSFVKERDDEGDDLYDDDDGDDVKEAISTSPRIDLSFDKIPFSSTIPSILLANNTHIRKRLSGCNSSSRHRSFTVENITNIGEIVPEWRDHFEELDEIMILSPKSTSSNLGGAGRDGSLSFLPAHVRFDTTSTPRHHYPRSFSMPSMPSSRSCNSSDEELAPPRLSQDEIFNTAGQIINILHCLHAKNIVHGALCPATISPNVADPGQLALNLLSSVSEIDTDEAERWVWFAPEIVLGWTFDESVDVWGFGVLLFWLTFRKHPFGIDVRDYEEDEVELEQLVFHGSIQFPDECEDLELRDLISTCLEHNPSARLNIQQVMEHDYFQNGDLPNLQTLMAEIEPTSAQRIVHHYRDTDSNPAAKIPLVHIGPNVRTSYISLRPESSVSNTGSPIDSLGTPISISAALDIIPEEDEGLTPEERMLLFWDRLDAEVRHKNALSKRKKLKKKRFPTLDVFPSQLKAINTSPLSAYKDKPQLPDGLHWTGSGIGYEHSSNRVKEAMEYMGCHPRPNLKAGLKKLVRNVRQAPRSPSQFTGRSSSDSQWMDRVTIGHPDKEPKVQRVQEWKVIELVRDSPNENNSNMALSGSSDSSVSSPLASLFERMSGPTPLMMTPGTEYTFSSTNASPGASKAHGPV